MHTVRHLRPASLLLRWADVVELWLNRELLFFLVWREWKVRYRQTAIGVLWAVFQPIATLVVFSFIFRNFLGINDQIHIPYPLFLYTGIILWVFFSNSVTGASQSLITQSELITKVYCPRLLIPTASVVVQMTDLVFSLMLSVPLFIFFGVFPNWQGILLLPVFLLQLVIISLGVGYFFAAVNVRYRDVRYILPFFVQLLFFVTPIIFSTRSLGKWGEVVLALNPLTSVIEGVRSTLFVGLYAYKSIFAGYILSLIVFLGGVVVFKYIERSFSDTL